MAAKKRPTYKGKLAKPMAALPRFGPLAQESTIKQALDMHSAEYADRMTLLFDHYEIPHGNFVALASALARDHVPGLQTMKDRPGAKIKWEPLDVARLQVALDTLMRDRNCTKAHAARILIKQEPWSSMAKTAVTLLRRGQTSHSHWYKMLSDAVRLETGKAPDEPITFADLARINW